MALIDATRLSPLAQGNSDHLLIVSYGEDGRQLPDLLGEQPFRTTYTEVIDDAQRTIEAGRPSLVLLYLDQEAVGPLQIIKAAVDCGAKVIVIGPGYPEKVPRQCLSQGAAQYLARPVSGGRLFEALGIPPVDRNIKEHETGDNNVHLEGALGMLFSPTSKMHQIADEVTRVAPTSATVFLRGESGTGKEIVAQAIHQLSERRNEPFVPVNCGAISPQLIESELFGHEKGSFTGAVKEHRGVFERADGGTLFLDEVTEMPIELQVKLLRVLETHRFTRVGSDRELSTNIRVIAATNRCPDTEVKEGRFRSDLLYRLQVFPILLPPLRERAGDIKLLAKHFLSEMNEQEGTRKRLSDKALAELEKYTWPGNLRELKNILQRAFIMSDSVIGPDQIPDEIMNPLEERDTPEGPCLQ
ncbi:MAG: sigma-54 dependent transcriptional regulator, partial [Marinobacter sp.]|nr:sigma-54 dependent transcriptional regulator [Marinobacter sp.]